MSGDVAAMTPDAVEHESGDELQLVGEHVLAIHHAVAVRVREDRNRVLRIAVLPPAERPAVLPRFRVRQPAAVGILGSLRDPQAAAIVPVDVHGLLDERLGGDERQVELRVHLDLRGGFGGGGGSPFDVAQAVAELVFLQELVDVRAFSGPRDPAQQDRAVVRAVEILVEMPGDRHERPIRRAAAVSGALVGPHLRLHVVRCSRACRRR